MPPYGSGTPPKIAPAPPSPESTLADISRSLFESTDPLRQSLISQSTNFLNSGMDPMSTPEFSAIRSYADQQSKQAKDSILETLPSGGSLLDKLADVDIGKARTLTDASAGIYSDNLNRATSLAMGAPLQGSLSAISAASQLDAAKRQAAAAQEAGEKNELGSAIGAVGGFYMGGPQGGAAGASAGGK